MGIILIIGCDSKTIEPDFESLGYSYYPLSIGQFTLYQVKEINYNVFGSDTLLYELRETITSTFSDNAGNQNYVLVREVKFEGEETWKTDSIWSTFRTEYHAVLNKNGNPVIPLVFPVSEGVEWDANGLSATNEDLYELKDVNVNYTIGDVTFASSVKVIQEDKPDSLAAFDYRIEVFAVDVGLIEKVDSRLKFCQDNDCFGNKIIEEGRWYHQKLIAYGKQ